MTAFILVHGAWHGPWAWERVVPLLERAGGGVAAPPLTLEPDIGLEEHVAEVIAALDRSESEVVLVGHSYAGLVVRQAADRRPEKVRRIILIEGWAGPAGTSLLSLAPSWFGDGIRAAADANGGTMIPAPGAAAFGIVDPDEAERLEARLRPHPLRTFTEPTELTGAVDAIPGTGIYSQPALFPFAELSRNLGYRTVPIDGPHDVMLTDPTRVARWMLD